MNPAERIFHDCVFAALAYTAPKSVGGEYLLNERSYNMAVDVTIYAECTTVDLRGAHIDQVLWVSLNLVVLRYFFDREQLVACEFYGLDVDSSFNVSSF